jgi:hypothetical protein
MTISQTLAASAILLCWACAAMLLRSWRQVRLPVLLWTSVGLTLIGVKNAVQLLETAVLAESDLMIARVSFGLLAGASLIYGLSRRKSS